MAPLPSFTATSGILDVLAERSRSSLARFSSRNERHWTQQSSAEGVHTLTIASQVVIIILGVFCAFVLFYIGWRGINHFFGPFSRGIKFEEAIRDRCSPIRQYRRWRRQRVAERKLNEETGRPTSSVETGTAESRERSEWLQRIAGEPSSLPHAQRRTSQIELPTAPEPRRKSSVVTTESVAPHVTRAKEFC